MDAGIKRELTTLYHPQLEPLREKVTFVRSSVTSKAYKTTLQDRGRWRFVWIAFRRSRGSHMEIDSEE